MPYLMITLLTNGNSNCMKTKLPVFSLFCMVTIGLLTSCGGNNAEYGEEEFGDDEFETRGGTMKPNLPTEKMTFEYGSEVYALDLPIDKELNRDFEAAEHLFRFTGEQPSDWRNQYYAMFLGSKADHAVIREIESQLKSLQPGVSGDELVELTVAFVQGAIEYDWETYHHIDEGTIRYPYETLFDGTGVCADKTILMAKLLAAQGYELAIFSYERANHMALGLKVPSGYGMYGTQYTFVESTGYAPIGRIPGNYVGGIQLENNPLVVKLEGGGGKVFKKIEANRRQEKEEERLYGRDFLFLSAEQKKIKREMSVLEEEMAVLAKKLRECNGTVSQEKYEECKAAENDHNAKVVEYNLLVARFNEINAERHPPSA